VEKANAEIKKLREDFEMNKKNMSQAEKGRKRN